MDSPQKSCSQMKIIDSAKTCKKKWFSNSSEHQNYLEGLLNHRLLGPSSRVSEGLGWSPRILVLMLLVWGPHFENNCSK